MDELLTAANRDRVLSVLRIVTGLLLLNYGVAKHFGFPPVPSFANIAPYSLIWFAGGIELIGGTLLVIGFCTRPVAFVVSGLMAFAYFLSHAPRSFYPVQNSGTAAILFCFVGLYLAIAGGGAWSIDALRRNKTI